MKPIRADGGGPSAGAAEDGLPTPPADGPLSAAEVAADAAHEAEMTRLGRRPPVVFKGATEAPAVVVDEYHISLVGMMSHHVPADASHLR